MDQWNQERIEQERKEKIKRNKVYYTSKELVLNGLYVNCSGKSYYLADYDSVTIRKDDGSNFVLLGIVLIILGVLTISFFIGIIILAIGIITLFYREYFIVLIGKNGDTPLIKGRRSKMSKIVKKINQAMLEMKIIKT